jgi:hypothetical protein
MDKADGQESRAADGQEGVGRTDGQETKQSRWKEELIEQKDRQTDRTDGRKRIDQTRRKWNHVERYL